MKAFISVPMKGRTKENIEKSIAKMKAVAKAYLGEDIEFVNTIVEEKPPYELDKEHNSIWYLGKSLEILSQCDVLVSLNDIYDFAGCYIERSVAYRYGLKVLELDFKVICDDIYEAEKDDTCQCSPRD